MKKQTRIGKDAGLFVYSNTALISYILFKKRAIEIAVGQIVS